MRLTEAASSSIEGERQFRLLEGYDRLLLWLREGLNPECAMLALSTDVRDIRWARGHGEVTAHISGGTASASFTARLRRAGAQQTKLLPNLPVTIASRCRWRVQLARKTASASANWSISSSVL